MDLKSNLLVDQVASTTPYKDLEKNSTKTVCGKNLPPSSKPLSIEGNEIEILKELNKIKQTLNNSQNG